MKPKQKAKELVEKYANINGVYGASKQCARIAVDEIIKELTEEISPSIHGFRHQYWQEVKQEINKL